MIRYVPLMGQDTKPDPWKDAFSELQIEIGNLLPYLSDTNRAIYASRLRQCESKALEPFEAVRCALDVAREIRDLVGENPTERTESIPALGWALGGLVIGGLVTYMATRK
jgi:hypothetical protein